MTQKEFVQVILDILSPMPDVVAVRNKGHIVLYKDGFIFGKILAQSVSFLSDRNKFTKMETELIARLFKPKNQLNQSDLDIFLFTANKAWWLAKGKTINISNMRKVLGKI